MDSILSQLGVGGSPFSGVQTQPGLSLISLLQGGGLASPLGGAQSPFAGASLGLNSMSMQQMMLQSLMNSFQSLNGIWGGIAGGGGLGGFGGLGGGLGGFGGLGGLMGGGGLGSLMGGGLGSLMGGGLGSLLGGGGLGSMLGGFGSFGNQLSGFGGLGLLGGLGIPGFGAQLQGFGGISLPPLGGNHYQGGGFGGGLHLPPLPGQGGGPGGLHLPPLPGSGGPRDAQPINNNIDYKTLTTDQRNQLSGMTEEQRAELHLWGIQMGSSGKQDGGVLLNVLHHPEQFKPAEVAVAKRLAAEDQAKYGGITGKSLDKAFFGVYEQLTGKDLSQRYANSPVNFATGEVNMANRQSGKNGLSQYENETLQLWGHSPLFTGGKIDGSILEYAKNSKNTLEANLNSDDIDTLLNADKAADGVVNGGSLEHTFVDTLDHIYNGGPAATQQRTMDEALTEASQRRAGLLPPVDTRHVANSQEVNFFAQLFGSNDPSQCPFLNSGGAGGAGAAGSNALN